MGIYIFVFFYLCIFSILEMMRKRIKPTAVRKGLYVFAFLMMFFIAGFRYGLETDYWTYYREFYGESKRTLEFTFATLMQIVKALTGNYNVFLIVFSAITMAFKYKAFKGYKFCFSVLLIYFVRFFVQFDLNAIRQGLAIVVVFFALEQLRKEEIKKYILLILLATTIHAPAIILLVLPFLRKLKLSTLKVIFSIVIATVFRFYLLEKMIPLFNRFLPAIVSSNITVVHHLVYILRNNTTSDAIAVMSYIRIIIPVICLYYLTRNTSNSLFFKSYYVGAIFNIAFLGLDTIGFRLAAYFYAAEILMMGDLYNSVIPTKRGEVKTRIRKFIPLFSVLFCDMWTFFSLLSASETLVPFRTFFGQ